MIGLWQRVLAVALALACASGCDTPRYQNRTETQWIRDLESPDTRTRVWAALALDAMDANSERTRHALVLALSDSSPQVEVAAIKALAGTGEGGTRRDQLLVRLWQHARDTTSHAQLGALEALALAPYQDDRSIPFLIDALRQGAEATRATAAASLRQFGRRAASAENALHAALRDSSEVVRHEAEDALRAVAPNRH